jgi:hydrogenase maturation protease
MNGEAVAMNPSSPPRITVLGIGNLLWADEGFGVRCVEALQQRYEFADNVTLIDGGTQGIYLVQEVRDADILVVFDAVDYGLPPGTLKVVEGAAVPAFLGARKMSLHQTGFQEVLAVAGLRGWQPEAITLIGCQPEILDDYGGSLSPVVRQALPDAVALAVRRLADWGGAPERRSQPLDAAARITLAALDLDAYEAGRPSAATACRRGDARFYPPAAGAS